MPCPGLWDTTHWGLLCPVGLACQHREMSVWTKDRHGPQSRFAFLNRWLCIFLPCKDTSCYIWQIQGCFTDRTDEPRVNQSLLSCPSLYSGFKIIIQFHLSMITCPRRCLLFLAIELILYVRFKGMPRCWFENFGHMAVEIGFLRLP